MNLSLFLRGFVVLIFFTAFALEKINAQSYRYVVLFKDKVGTTFSTSTPEAYLSERALTRRQKQGIAITEKDLPVSQVYLDSIEAEGIEVLYTTKWLNGALLEFDTEQELDKLNGFSFIKKHNFNFGVLSLAEVLTYTETVQASKSTQSDTIDYGYTFEQLSMLGVPAMHAAGFTGKGMMIAVFDAGFRNVDDISAFDSLRAHNRIVNTYDFVEREENVFDDHDHGTKVLSVIAANLPNNLVGAAFEASYVLLRSEEVANESRLEEFYWLLAAEYADSLGVDIINSSLGYNIFDDAVDNYNQADLDGESALITIAADLAASTGMLVVNSAGNEGNSSWGTLTPPADADSILTVGAVTAMQNYAGFSSIGPTTDGRIKPDVVARGTSVAVSSSGGGITYSNGTSFSTPLISGLAAGIWQANPDFTNMELINTIKLIASQSESADNQVGYGVPDFTKLLPKVGLEDKEIEVSVELFPNPTQAGFAMVFPKVLEGREIKLRVFSASGQLLIDKMHRINQNKIDVEQLHAKGLLLIKVEGKGISISKRLLSN